MEKSCDICGRSIRAHNSVGVCQRDPACKREGQKRWARANPEKQKERKRRDQIRNGRRYDLQKRFGLTLEEYDRLFAEQGGVCAICGNPESARDQWNGRVRRLAVDHDHETGRVRGLLCGRCNTSIRCHLTPKHFRAIALYLERR